MSYKHLGCEVVSGCTPAPSFYDMFSERFISCREQNHCTKECIPKKLECNWCHEKSSTLNVLENTETGEKIKICNKCERSIDNIIY